MNIEDVRVGDLVWWNGFSKRIRHHDNRRPFKVLSINIDTYSVRLAQLGFNYSGIAYCGDLKPVKGDVK